MAPMPSRFSGWVRWIDWMKYWPPSLGYPKRRIFFFLIQPRPHYSGILRQTMRRLSITESPTKKQWPWLFCWGIVRLNLLRYWYHLNSDWFSYFRSVTWDIGGTSDSEPLIIGYWVSCGVARKSHWSIWSIWIHCDMEFTPSTRASYWTSCIIVSFYIVMKCGVLSASDYAWGCPEIDDNIRSCNVISN